MFGFYRIATCVPQTRVADVAYNVSKINEAIVQASLNESSINLFPELCLSSYTCGDLFYQKKLLDDVELGVREILKKSKGCSNIIVVGAPIKHRSMLFNVAIVIQDGRILGIVPKSILPNRREFYEKRHFVSGAAITEDHCDYAGCKDIPFGVDILFSVKNAFVAGIELCEDMWGVVPPSCKLALAGANVILNLSASNELVGKASYRRDLVRMQSARCSAVYAYVSAGALESTTDTVFGGHCIVAENGSVLLDSPRFSLGQEIYYTDVDVEKVDALRLSEASFAESAMCAQDKKFRTVSIDKVCEPTSVNRTFSRKPFVPENSLERDERCEEILDIQSMGLAKRILHTNCNKIVLGISGGLDSTLALLVAVRSMKKLDRPMSDVVAITMPGFGTTDRTYNNAVKLVKELGAELREISIKDACILHFEDIGHDINNHNVVYENVQARERTQILMDVANACGGIVLGTGDLSEIAMGFCTYNADHMSMYGINCGIPKTLIRYLISNECDKHNEEVRKCLLDIIDTPVSPELLPASDAGEIEQKTEEILGPYEVLDFFLYYFVKCGFAPDKLQFLAEHTFTELSQEKIKEYLQTFIRRFFTQQFKRNCIPDGPKVGTIALSPRADWRMPSDASFSNWL